LTATITGDVDDLRVLVDALAVEESDEFPGVETALEHDEPDRARLKLAADRLPQLRAAVNAHLRWIRTVEDTLAAGTAEEPTQGE
jgi:tRNA threonylcarbamoyladenosine modification (KEOPS) complex  Pcc1 subunit